MPLTSKTETPMTVNMTPMIDIVFLLLIFFMVGTKFSEWERKMELDLPEAGAASASAPEVDARVVTVLENGDILLDERPIDGLERLTSELVTQRTDNPDLCVRIRADARNDWDRVASVLGACEAADIHTLDVDLTVGNTPQGRVLR